MLLIWIGFIALILALLALDLGVFHRKAHVVSIKEALIWSAVWIACGLSFSVFVYFAYEGHWLGMGKGVDAVDGQVNDGHLAVVKYLTGYVVEKSLSVDNIFVIAMLFGYFAVPTRYQHRVLYWGILGALVMRGTMIGVGTKLISEFHWILYVFGAFLILTAVKMLLVKESDPDPGKNPIVRLARRFLPITDKFHEQHFFVRGTDADTSGATAVKVGTLMLTPLALALIMIETTDLIFAVDSIPAIFAITADPFLVFTSNVFAILGLRALYFALAGMMDKFRFLKPALAAVLAVVGVKMLTADWLKQWIGEHFNLYLLGVVMSILAVGVIASLLFPARPTESSPEMSGEERAIPHPPTVH